MGDTHGPGEPTITELFPIVSTSAMDRSVGFYRDLLGGVVGYEFHLRSSGVTVIEEPADQPWGERTARVLDPDGNEIIVGQRAAPDAG